LEVIPKIDVDVSNLTPLLPEGYPQATINLGTVGHVAHGKSTVVMAISGVMTVRFKNELIRNITTELGYAKAKVREALPLRSLFSSQVLWRNRSNSCTA
ncbi:hypothetical protein EDB85DRAFT_1863972, partial [Lactarius pseudohatsudake]